MASETGAITAQYVYTPYGVESPYNASGNPFRYTGRRLDARWGVYYYRARYYDPQLGRFLETDPAGYVDSMNLYAYVGHDPLNGVDPTGECAEENGNLTDCDVNFTNGESKAQGEAVVNAVATVVSGMGPNSARSAMNAIDTVNIGPGQAVDAATGAPAQATASFNASGSRIANGDYSANKTGGTLNISSDAVIDPSTGQVNVDVLTQVIYHEMGHGTPESIKAAVSGDVTSQENIAEHVGIVNAIRDGALGPQTLRRIYTSPTNFYEVPINNGQ